MCTSTSAVQVTPKFVLAGNAIFTVHNASNEHYTFRVKKHQEKSLWFVQLLTGPDNTADYTYLGMINENGQVRLTAKSKFNSESKPFRVLSWAMKRLWLGFEFPEGYGVNAEGRCCRCGRTLTTPEGVDPKGYRFGFGPDCWKIVNGA